MKDVKLEPLGGGRFRLISFVEDDWPVDASYSDYSKQFDVRTGAVIDMIMIEPTGKVSIEGVRLQFSRECRNVYPIPPNILRNRPLTAPSTVYIPFLDALDLRSYHTGDVKLGLTVNQGEPGGRIIITYQTSMFLKEDC